MAYINDKNLPYLVEKLSNADNIKINNNKHGSRVSTVINSLVTKSDNVTKAIEQEIINDSHSFKVGTGNVNVSADVQDGFGEVGVKGVTYQNLLGTLVAVGKEWVESDNKYTLNLPSGSGQPQIRYNLAYPLKPNTKYTLICEIKEYTTGYPHFCFMTGDNKLVASTIEFTPNTVGIHSAVLATTSDITAELLRILPRSNTDNIYSIGKNIVILEGDHTNNPNLPTYYFDSFVHVGSTGKNLFNINDTVIGFLGGINNILPPDHNNLTSNYIKVKPNTRYTYSIGGYDKPTNVAHWSGWYYYKDKYGTLSTITPDRQTKMGSDDSYKTMSFTTPSDCYYIRIGSRHLSLPNAWAQLEGSEVATPYEPFTYKVEILSCGKNLLPYDNASFGPSDSTWWDALEQKRHYKGAPTWETSKSWFYLPEGNYKFTYKQLNNCSVQIVDRDEKLLNMNGFFKGGDISVRIRNMDTALPFGYEKMQIERVDQSNSSSTPYVPYVSDKVQILLDEPLMRLPNGVCDEITRDGRLIRRVKKVVLDGNENWNLADGNKEKTIRFSMIPQIPFKISTEAISDKFPYYQSTGNDVECFTVAADTRIHIRITRSKLNVANVQGFKEWLSQNPTTVYYELSTPIITELPAPCLRIFKDGHITFNTLVAPESNHVVQLNKSAQIERSIKEVQSLDGRVEQLESFYDDMMLETSYKLDLLNYDFEYTKEREDE